jgi:hypothetical protein
MPAIESGNSIFTMPLSIVTRIAYISIVGARKPREIKIFPNYTIIGVYGSIESPTIP